MYNLKDKNILTSIINIVESQENKERIQKHSTDYEIVNGNQKQVIIDSLKKMYPESWPLMRIIALAIAKKIIRKLSRCYSAGCVREVVDILTGEKNEELTNLITAVYANADETGNDFNMVMQKGNEYYSNHRYVEVFAYEDELDLIRFKSMPQHLFTAIPNKNKSVAEIIVFKQSRSDFLDIEKFIDWDESPVDENETVTIEGIYTIWTKEENFTVVNTKRTKFQENGVMDVIFMPAIVKRPANQNGINPYGIMPFSQIKEITEGVFYPYGVEIADMSKEVNLILCDIVSIAAQQGFGQAVIYYDSDVPPAITKSGPTNVINIPNKTGNSKFEFANANPDLPGHMSVCLSLVRMLLTTNDLTTDKVSGELSATNFASAIDRLIADSETVENIDDQRKKYVVAEKNMFNIVMAMLRYKKSVGSWPKEYPDVPIEMLDENKYVMKVHFGTIKPLITEKEKAETITYLEEKGFIFPWEKQLRFNDSLTEQQAKARYEEIEEFRRERAQEMLNSQYTKDAMHGQDESSDQSQGTDSGNENQDGKPINPK
jgi:hypothetical protein